MFQVQQLCNVSGGQDMVISALVLCKCSSRAEATNRIHAPRPSGWQASVPQCFLEGTITNRGKRETHMAYLRGIGQIGVTGSEAVQSKRRRVHARRRTADNRLLDLACVELTLHTKVGQHCSALLAEALGSSKQGWHEDGQAAAQAMGMAWRASKDGMKVGKQPLKQWGQHSWWPFVLLVLIKLACMSVRSKQVSLAADSTHQKLANLCIDTQVCAHARACAPTNTHTYTHTPGGASPGAAHGVGWREGRAGRIWCRHLLDCCCGCCCCCCYSCVVVADFGWGWGMAWAGCTPFLVLDSSEGV
eukprot:1158520-Pelagomonas_calceolata.AAC.3